MTQPAKLFRVPEADRRDWLEAFMEPWAESLAERLRARPWGAVLVLGQSGSGRGFLCQLTAALGSPDGRCRQVDLDRCPERTRRSLASYVSQSMADLVDEGLGAPGKMRIALLRGVDEFSTEDLRELLRALGDLRAVDGLRLLVPMDLEDLEDLEEDLVERAFNLRLHVPSPGLEEVRCLVRERFASEGIEREPGPEGARRALAATGGRPRALIRFLETYFLARAVAGRGTLGVEALDAWWWWGRVREQDREGLQSIIQAMGAQAFFRPEGSEAKPGNGNLPFRTLENEDPDQRREVIEDVLEEAVEGGLITSESRRKDVLAALSDPNPGVRKAAVYALVEMGDPETAEALIPLLRDGEPEDRRAAAYATGRLAPSFGGEVLMAALEDPQPEVRQAAASALAALGGAEAVPSLLRHMTDATQAVRMSAESALLRLAETEGAEPFLTALSSEDTRERTGSAKVAGSLGLPEIGPALHARLSDECSGVRRYAAASLGTLGDEGAVPVLIQALTDPDPAVREAAGSSINHVTGEEIGAVLPRYLGNGDPALKEMAVLALRELRPVTAVDPLIGLLDHPDMEVRQEAAGLLGCLGDTRAIEPLMRCHDKDWPEVGRIVSASLVRLGVDGAANGGNGKVEEATI